MSALQDFVFRAQKRVQVTPKLKDLIWPEFKLVQDYKPVLGTCKFDADQTKNESLQHFPLML